MNGIAALRLTVASAVHRNFSTPITTYKRRCHRTPSANHSCPAPPADSRQCDSALRFSRFASPGTKSLSTPIPAYTRRYHGTVGAISSRPAPPAHFRGYHSALLASHFASLGTSVCLRVSKWPAIPLRALSGTTSPPSALVYDCFVTATVSVPPLASVHLMC